MQLKYVFILIVVSLTLVYFMNKKYNEQIKRIIVLSNQIGKLSQIQDNIEHGVMNNKGEWLNEFKLAR